MEITLTRVTTWLVGIATERAPPTRVVTRVQDFRILSFQVSIFIRYFISVDLTFLFLFLYKIHVATPFIIKRDKCAFHIFNLVVTGDLVNFFHYELFFLFHLSTFMSRTNACLKIEKIYCKHHLMKSRVNYLLSINNFVCFNIVLILYIEIVIQFVVILITNIINVVLQTWYDISIQIVYMETDKTTVKP